MSKVKPNTKAWAIELARGITNERARLSRDKRATAEYWNCDSWGSISGMRDAAEWMENELAKYIARHVKPRRKINP